MRGGRCEGRYEPEFSSSSSLALVSLVQWREPLDVGMEDTLIVTWESSGSPGGVVHLRGQGFGRKALYYQMDAEAQRDQGRFLWSTDVLNSLGIRREHLGLVAWVDRHALRGIPEDPNPCDHVSPSCYLPVVLGREDSIPDSAVVEMVIVSRAEVEQFKVVSAKITDSGEEGVREQEYSVPGWRVSHEALLPVWGPGLYRVEVSCDYRGRGHGNLCFYCVVS